MAKEKENVKEKIGHMKRENEEGNKENLESSMKQC